MAEVVGSLCEGRGGLGGRETSLAGPLPDASVDGVGYWPTAGASEQSAVWCCAVLGEVLLKDGNELWRARYEADIADRSVFELPGLSAVSVSPCLPSSWCRVRQAKFAHPWAGKTRFRLCSSMTSAGRMAA